MRTPLHPPNCDVAAARESGLPAGQILSRLHAPRTPVDRTAIVIAALTALLALAPVSMPQVGPGSASAQPGTIDTVAGNGEVVLGDGGPATDAQLAWPEGVAVDSWGNLYIADPDNHRVRKVDSAGVITTVAGTGQEGYNGDGGLATEANLWAPAGVAVDGSGNLYIADRSNHRVRRLNAARVITTVAGSGEWRYGGDGSPATSAQLSSPEGVAVDTSGNLYIADSASHRVRRVDPAGVITTVAGTGDRGHSGDGGPATSAQLSAPEGVAVDGSGNLYIAGGNRVRKVDRAGIITTVAGTGDFGYSGDGGPATEANLSVPEDLAVDAAGNLYVAGGNRVRKVDSAGVITTIAGTGDRGHSGDGGPATEARLSSPEGVAVDSWGNLYIADSASARVRRVDRAGVITTVAGTGDWGYSGDGGPATEASLLVPAGVAVDTAGNLYIADRNNHRVRRITWTGGGGTVPPVAADDHGNDASSATRLALNSSHSGRIETPGDEDWFRLETSGQRNLRIRTTGGLDSTGTLFDASNRELASDDDGGNNLNFSLEAAVAAGVYYVRVKGDGSKTGSYKIQENGQAVTTLPDVRGIGVITTVAGTGEPGFGGDGGPATEANLWFPRGVAVDGSGNLYIADRSNHRVRRVGPGGVITTVAGTGEEGYSGDGGPATESSLRFPRGVAVDGSGNLYIADSVNHRVRRVDPGGVITTVAGTGRYGYSGDGGPATGARLNSPDGVVVDGSGNLYIADSVNHRVRRVDPEGVITTVAGTGDWGYSGDGGPATEARLFSPRGVAVDGSGNLYIADDFNSGVRKVDPAGVITTVAGTGQGGYSGDGGPATGAQLSHPLGVAVDGSGNLYIADAWNNRVRKVDPEGVITTVAGTGQEVYSGDGGPATEASLWSPRGVAVDGAGNLYIADLENHRVRRVTWTGGGGTAPPVAANDHGNDAASATRLALNSSLSGRIETPGDEDWFRLETSGPRDVKIRTTGSTDTVGWLFDASNRQLAHDDDGGDGFNFALEAAVPAGVYYVRVKGLGSATGRYTIHEQGQPASQLAGLVSNYRIDTFAGSGERGDGGAAIEALLAAPVAVAVDGAGNLYIADSGNNRIRKVGAAGIITTIAGTGEECGWSGCLGGDGGPATEAQLAEPSGVAVDGAGNLYIADSYNHRIRKVDAAGIITTVAGSGGTGEGGYGFGGDRGPATEAQLAHPRGVAVDGAGNFYIADTYNNRIRKVDAAGIITTIAGTGEGGYSFGGDGRAATEAQLAEPSGVAVDGAGNLYIADTGNDRIRMVDPAGIITTVAGSGESGFGGDGGQAVQAQLAHPRGVAADAAGNLYIADTGNDRIRNVDLAGVITTVAGFGEDGFSGDGGAAEQAQLGGPSGVAVDGSGGLFIADSYNHRIRKVDSTGTIATIVGGFFSGDGRAADQAYLGRPKGVAVDAAGNVYIADTSNHRIRKVDAAGIITTIAGTGEGDYSFGGDGGAATEAQLAYPSGVAADAAGNVYIADTSNHRIRKVDPAGTITTVAGSGEPGLGGDGGQAHQAKLDNPFGVAVDGAGSLYIADSSNHRIRKVDPAGTITTVAGSGEPGFGGDGGQAHQARLDNPFGVAVDGTGSLYIADTSNHRIRKVDAAGIISTIAGWGGYRGPGEQGGCTSCEFSGDGGPATEAGLGEPSGVAVDAAGNVYIADTYNHRIRKVDAAGIITTIAGTGARCELYAGCFGGDGGPATDARLNSPAGVAVDPAGNLYIADSGNNRVRRMTWLGGSGTVPPVVADDHGNDAASATTLVLNRSYTGTIETPGDEDWFRLETSGPRNLWIRTTGGLDTIGTLFDASNRELASDDDGGSGLNFSLEAAVAAGVYYVRVQGFSSETGTYTIHESGEDGDGFAPADEPTFNSRMVGNRVIAQILSIDFVSAGRFVLSGRFPGSYSYSSTGSEAGAVTLLFDAGGSGTLRGQSLNLQFTFASASRGSLALSGGATSEWILSGISELGRPPAPLFQDRGGARLDFFIFDVFERFEVRAYDLQFRAKTSPPASWQTGCVGGADPPDLHDVSFRAVPAFVTNVPRGTHQVRYRHRNSCGSGTPGEWSEIGEEGVTRWPW